MKFYTLISIIFISFVLNGCILDRIKQRLYAKKQIEKQEEVIKQRESKATTVQKATEVKKVYKPSKATAPIYAEENKVEVKPVTKYKKAKSSVKTTKKKYSKKRKHKRKKVALKPEPYSIGKDEQDPELLGPQTTLDSNPLTKNSKVKDSKKKKI